MKRFKDYKSFLVALALFLALPGLTLLGQDEDEGGDDAAADGGDAGGGDAGGGSAAEGAVTTGGASQPAAATSGSIESNPVITLVRAGVSWDNAKVIEISTIIKIASAGGTLAKFVETAGKIEAGTVDVEVLETLIDADISLDAAVGLLEGDGNENLTTNLDLLSTASGWTTNSELYAATAQVIGEAQYTTGFQTALEAAVGVADAILTNKTITSESGLPTALNVASLAASGYTTELIRLLAKYGAIGSNGDSVASSVLGTDYTAFTSSQTLSSLLQSTTAGYLGNLADLGARTFAEENSGSSVLKVSMSNVTLAPAANITLGTTPVNLYPNGYAPTSLDGFTLDLGAWEEVFKAGTANYGNSYNLSSIDSNTIKVSINSEDPQEFTLSFDGPNSGTYSWSLWAQGGEKSGSPDQTVTSTPFSITAGKRTETSSETLIDVSTLLPKATSASDRKVYVIGAAKDLTIAGDVTFTNTNTAEDHALVIGAADDLYFRSEYSTANNADYADPDPITVKYTGSNLGIGSHDTMTLVNVNLETGGNLALGTLDELHIGLTDSHSSTFSVGTGGKNSDPDNVYLYANTLIQANGLQFSGRLDDVYMEAITINLKDVAFPSTADVMLRSRDGALNFGTYATPVVGSVNLTEVSHGGTTLSESHFSGADGHINSSITLPNGTSAIKIRGQ